MASNINTQAFTEPIKFLTPSNGALYSARLYQRLDVKRKEIRLLELLPGEGDQKIECRLIQKRSLYDRALKYRAISYCAGDPEETKEISLEGICANLFASVYGALLQLRDKHQPTLLWVDQVCIDQSNITEREHQVSIMCYIYAKAESVLAWLGEEDAEGRIARAFALMAVLGVNFAYACGYHARLWEDEVLRHFPACSKPFPDADDFVPDNTIEDLIKRAIPMVRVGSPIRLPFFSLDSFLDRLLGKDSFPEPLSPLSEWLTKQMNIPAIEELISCIEEILTRPWWDRCWTAQEGVMASELTIMCGSLRIDSDYILVTQMLISQLKMQRELVATHSSPPSPASKRLHPLLRDYFDGWEPLHHLVLRLSSAIGNPGGGILLRLVRGKGVTDPRDTVYSLVSLMPSDYKIMPKYGSRNTVEDVFIEITKAIILHEFDLDFVCEAGEPDRDPKSTLPSWVPEITITNFRSPSKLGVPHFGQDVDASLLQGKLGEEHPLFTKEMMKPIFLPDEYGRADRIMQCTVLDLGPVATQASLGQVFSRIGEDPGWTKLYETAGQNGVYLWTEPKCEESLQTAFVDTITSNNRVRKIDYQNPESHYVCALRCRFFITPEGKMGLGPPTARFDDRICITIGSSIPWILRPCSDGKGYYTFVGFCYLHGYMQGQAIIECLRGQRASNLKSVRIR